MAADDDGDDDGGAGEAEGGRRGGVLKLLPRCDETEGGAAERGEAGGNAMPMARDGEEDDAIEEDDGVMNVAARIGGRCFDFDFDFDERADVDAEDGCWIP